MRTKISQQNIRDSFSAFQKLILSVFFVLMSSSIFSQEFNRDVYLQQLLRSDTWLDYYPVNYEPKGFDSIFNGGTIDTLIARQNKKPIYPKYVVIGMPGGDGLAHIELKQKQGELGEKWISGSWHPGYEVLKSFWAWGFPERARDLFIDDDFIFMYTDSTANVDRVSALVQQLQKTFKNIKVYVHGISRGTNSTMSLGESMDGMIAGFIHSSAMNSIASYRTDDKKSRHLLIHHIKDGCDGTLLSNSELNRDRYGTKLIVIDNQIDVDTGDRACGPFTYHGFFQSDQKVVEIIKSWIREDQ